MGLFARAKGDERGAETLTLTTARGDLDALRAERRRLVDQCEDIEQEIQALFRSAAADAIKTRMDLRAKLARLRSEVELLDTTMAARASFVREVDGELGGLLLRKQRIETALSNQYFDSHIAQCRAALERAEAEKAAALIELKVMQDRIDELSR